MRLGIISDTHSRYATVAKALDLLRAHAVEMVLHCGDIEDGQTIRMFEGLPTHFVLGNCDYDVEEVRQAVQEIGATLHEPYGHLDLGGQAIAWLHGDDHRLLRDLESSDHFDYLFYGHTHVAAHRQTGRTQVINPGALHRARVKSFVVLDTDKSEFTTVVVE